MCVSMANASAALAPGLSMGLDIPPLFNSLVASETGPELLPVYCPVPSDWARRAKKCVCVFTVLMHIHAS